MPRYAAFLRGVTPMNAAMPELKRAFEDAGFTDVVTVLSSGNVVFTAPRAADATLQRAAEAAMTERLGRGFLTIVRPVDALRALIADDPWRPFPLAPGSKRIVVFLRETPRRAPVLPLEQHGARLLLLRGREVLGAYVQTPRGPVFMSLIEKTLGKEVTTRTWDTVAKVARK